MQCSWKTHRELGGKKETKPNIEAEAESREEEKGLGRLAMQGQVEYVILGAFLCY